MKNRFITWTSGWIPVSVLLLFATTLVMGRAPSEHARVEPSAEIAAEPAPDRDDPQGPVTEQPGDGRAEAGEDPDDTVMAQR